MSAKKLGVIGHPIAHSKSPMIHNYWIKKYGLEGMYEALDIPPDSLESGLRDLIARGYSGFNLTVPHKEIVMDLCDVIDETARAVGAVNTIICEDGKIEGRNTDVFGFVQNIKDEAPHFDFTAGPAVVIGAGGAARAAVQGLLAEGAPQIYLLNRTKEKANFLAQESMAPEKVNVYAWEQRSDVLQYAHLLVNTTSLGMEGQPALDLDLSGLPEHALVHDIVYAPLYTPLLLGAQQRGNPIVTGIGMLLQQARPAFDAWFGILPEIDETLKQKVLA